jgi:L-rhamnose mutarotase
LRDNAAMNKDLKTCWLAALLAATLGVTGCAHQPVRRVGMVVGIREDKIAAYKQLHADSNPGVRDLLTKYHMHNFSIFLQQIDGKWYEFGYYEYTGNDFEGDMARLDKEPRNLEWLKACDPMQLPLPGAKGWTKMERCYFNP